MLARPLVWLAVLAAQALLALGDPPYEVDIYEGPADVVPGIFYKFYLADDQCSGDITSLVNCPEPDALRVKLYDYVFLPKVTLSYNDKHYFTQISLERRPNAQGHCKGQAIVYVYARCANSKLLGARDGGMLNVQMQQVPRLVQVHLPRLL